LREVARRAEAARELVEEVGVEVELAIARAVERSARSRRLSARGPCRAAEQDEPRLHILGALRFEDRFPDVLGVAEDRCDEILLRIAALRGRRLSGR
jgi:hypothetical protein